MTRREPRWWFVVYSTGLGAVVAAVAWAGGQERMAVFSLLWLTLGGVALAMTPYGRLRSAALDEREHGIDRDALAWTGGAMTAVSLVGCLVELYRGEPGPFTLIGTVGGATYTAALAVLASRR